MDNQQSATFGVDPEAGQTPTNQEPGVQPVQQNKFNIFAILSIVFVFVPFLPIIFGIVALIQISKSKERGKTLAILGIILPIIGFFGFLMFMGAIAYFGVLSPDNFLPPRCEFEAGLQCTEIGVADHSDQTITIALTNALGYDIDYRFQEDIGHTDTYGCSIKYSGDTFTTGEIQDDDGDGTWENGETAIVEFGGCELPDPNRRFREEVTINYKNLDSGMTHPSVGVVAGKVSQ